MAVAAVGRIYQWPAAGFHPVALSHACPRETEVFGEAMPTYDLLAQLRDENPTVGGFLCVCVFVCVCV